MSLSQTLKKLDRVRLQDIAKKNGIRANLKSHEIIAILKKRSYNNKENIQISSSSSSSSSSSEPKPKKKIIRSSSSSSSSPSSSSSSSLSSPSKKPKNLPPKNRKSSTKKCTQIKKSSTMRSSSSSSSSSSSPPAKKPKNGKSNQINKKRKRSPSSSRSPSPTKNSKITPPAVSSTFKKQKVASVASSVSLPPLLKETEKKITTTQKEQSKKKDEVMDCLVTPIKLFNKSPNIHTPSESNSKGTPLQEKKLNSNLLLRRNSSQLIPESPLMKKLGDGSDVCVYRYERQHKSPWAIKRLTKQANEIITRRLQAEASILKLLDHPHIVGYRGFSTTSDGRLSLHLECCNTSLLSLLDNLRIPTSSRPPPFPPHHIITVALHTSRALHYLHSTHHLLHGDMKPDNVLIMGDFDAVKICDFGVCLKLKKGLRGQANPKDEVYLGTDQYLPWETIHGTSDEITDRADIYAFGLVLWEMITIEIPHEHAIRWVMTG